MLVAGSTMYDALKRVAGTRPAQEVFVCGPVRLRNRRLVELVDATAAALAGLRIGRGERIVILLPPGPAFVALFFAAARVGAVLVPLSPQLPDRTLVQILEDASPRLVVATRPIGEEVLRSTAAVERVVIADAAADEPPLGSIGSFDTVREAPAPVDLLALLYTSGTTGTPKATMHTHASLIAPVTATLKVRELWQRPSNVRRAAAVVKALARYRGRIARSIGRPQTIMSTAGWHTITGLHVMLQGLLMGDRLLAMAKFEPRAALELVERERVTVLVAVPFAYQAMLSLTEFDSYDHSSLLVCASGGAACPVSLAHEIQRRFGCALYNGFGMTEAAGGVAVSDLSDSMKLQAQTVGRPMPGVDVKIVDPQRRQLPVGEVGELAVHGEGIMKGYYNAPEATAEVLDGEGWFYTGDLATIDDAGYLRIVGRKKDLIIRGGQNIFPAEVEGYLETHPRIAEAAVVGVPAAVGGESVWAFVRLAEGAQMSAQELLDYCRGKLDLYKIPTEVRFVSQLPRSELGKYQKFKLREAAMGESAGGEE